MRSARELIPPVATVVGAAAAALASVRWLLPSRMDGGSGGLPALLARLRAHHPLLLVAAFFLAYATAANYWRLRFWDRPRPDEAPRRARASRFLILLALLAAATFAVRARVAEVERVLSPSMVPTLNVGDRVLVNKRAYAAASRPPRRGDVIVFPSEAVGEAPGGPRLLVKRVLGVAGDVVSFGGGSPTVNGRPLPACDAGPFLRLAGEITVRGRLAVEFLDGRAYLTVRTPLDETTFPSYRVPPGEVFVLGDDRGLSRDSRSWNQGRGTSVPVAAIVGNVSRLAVAARPDGGLDLGTLLAPLGLDLRDQGVDLRKTRERIATCLRDRPR